MGNFRVEIKLKTSVESSESILTYTNKQLKDLNTRTFATNNPTRPIFNAFSNDGRIIIKDTDLSLFNKAINGDFDEIYQFEVNIYKGNNCIATHIVNERPQYDYANKTLTLNLGNEIDNFKNLTYKGYSYPLEGKYAKAILIDILGIKEQDIENKLVFEKEDNFETNIAVPYLPQDTIENSLNKVLEVGKSSLIQLPDKKYKLVNMLETVLPNATYSKPIYKILPNHINQSFIPNVILDNKFSKTRVLGKQIYQQDETQTVYNETKNVNASITSNWVENQHNETLYAFEGWFKDGYAVGIQELKQYYYNIETIISKYINNNLGEIISIESDSKDANGDWTNGNPIVNVVTKTFEYKYTGETLYCVYERLGGLDNLFGFKFTTWFPEEINANDKIYKGLGFLDLNIENVTIWQKKGEPKIEEKSNFNIQYTKDFGNSKILTVSSNFYKYKYNQAPTVTKNDENGQFELFAQPVIGKVYLTFNSYATSSNDEIDSSWYDKPSSLVPIQDIILTQELPVSVTITYNGIVKQIKFEDIFSEIGEKDINILELSNNNELISKNSAKEFANSLNTYYQDGIRTGKLSVIFANYKSNNDNDEKDIDTPFEIGDLVIPCKDYNGTPIITKNENEVVYKVIENEIDLNGGAGIQNLTVVEVPKFTIEIGNGDEDLQPDYPTPPDNPITNLPNTPIDPDTPPSGGETPDTPPSGDEITIPNVNDYDGNFASSIDIIGNGNSEWGYDELGNKLDDNVSDELGHFLGNGFTIQVEVSTVTSGSDKFLRPIISNSTPLRIFIKNSPRVSRITLYVQKYNTTGNFELSSPNAEVAETENLEEWIFDITNYNYINDLAYITININADGARPEVYIKRIILDFESNEEM